ncbi:MAG: 1-acyl-sn-glycerol-3-phosphate acyltransferase [Syntrophus sp. (in: bacteria)]|nr:1-acyl-sn-glycerol-3-phosphate acyltransferase [Syntrophus sp. (in: bacteria)]
MCPGKTARRGGGVGKPGITSLLYSVPMNLFAYPAIMCWTFLGICVFPILFALWKIFTDWDNSRIVRRFIWFYGKGWVVIMSPFLRFKRMGLEKDKINPPYVIVMNHLSYFDYYCMGLLPFSNVAAAVRSWPFKMPWYAPFMRLAGFLDVESLGPDGSLQEGAETLSKGGSVIFFPEGHRSRDGKLQRFFSGPFKLSVETGVKVLPLCLTGTGVLLPPGRWWLLPAKVRLKALPPIDPKAFDGPFAHIKLRKHTKAIMAEAIEKMRAI